MADVIQVERGFAPWQPAESATLVKEYQYYDMPLSGVIDQFGVRYLFTCVDGAQDEVNLWSYVLLTGEEEEALDSSSTEDFHPVLKSYAPVVLALAVDGLGIAVSRVVDFLTPETKQAAYRELDD